MVIGLLICEVLEDEMINLISKDTDFERVTFVESEPGEDLIAGLRETIGDRLNVVSSVAEFEPDPSLSLEVLATVLRVGLHMDKELLQEGVKEKGTMLASKSDSLLLGYGLCGNVLLDIDKQMNDVKCPIVMPQNVDGTNIDDCVCLVLGGTEHYLAHVFKEAGTWFVTPGWLKHWETLLLKELGAPDVKTVKWIFDKADYKRCLMVDTGIGDYEKFRKDTQEFADKFGFYVEEYKGTLELLEDSFRRGKKVAIDLARSGVDGRKEVLPEI